MDKYDDQEIGKMTKDAATKAGVAAVQQGLPNNEISVSKAVAIGTICAMTAMANRGK